MSKLKDTLIDGDMKVVNDLTLGGGVYLQDLTKGDAQLKIYTNIFQIVPDYNEDTTIKKVIQSMPDYSILTYGLDANIVSSNEVNNLIGEEMSTVRIVKMSQMRAQIFIYSTTEPIIYYRPYRSDADNIQWTIIGRRNWKGLQLNSLWKTYNKDGYTQFPRCRLESNNRVYLSGVLQYDLTKQILQGQVLTITNLPIGYRPRTNKIFITHITISSKVWAQSRIDVLTNGNINFYMPQTGTIYYLSLDQINFETD